MTEEINFSYDGGLYAKLIRNRTFRDNPQSPVNWSVAKYGGGEGNDFARTTARYPTRH